MLAGEPSGVIEVGSKPKVLDAQIDAVIGFGDCPVIRHDHQGEKDIVQGARERMAGCHVGGCLRIKDDEIGIFAQCNAAGILVHAQQFRVSEGCGIECLEGGNPRTDKLGNRIGVAHGLKGGETGSPANVAAYPDIYLRGAFCRFMPFEQAGTKKVV